jgi:transposase
VIPARPAESCDDEDLPNLITSVRTTVATATDVKQLLAIQEGLERSGLSPAEHLADGAYVSGSNLVQSHARRIDLIGPPYRDSAWQARAKEGFDIANFSVDWEKKVVSCPRGRQSVRWTEAKSARGRSMISIKFSASECVACPSRPSCTRAKKGRNLTLQPREEHEAIRAARRRQETEEFASIYSKRAGIEGTISQGVRAFGLRQARYRGLKRTHLQGLATAAAVNVSRVTDWANGVRTATTRRSRLAALSAAS